MIKPSTGVLPASVTSPGYAATVLSFFDELQKPSAAWALDDLHADNLAEPLHRGIRNARQLGLVNAAALEETFVADLRCDRVAQQIGRVGQLRAFSGLQCPDIALAVGFGFDAALAGALDQHVTFQLTKAAADLMIVAA